MIVDLGPRLKAARLRRNMTQKELAERICRCPTAVSGYESNAQIPPVDTLISIANVLDVSLDYLVGIEVGTTYTLRDLTASQQEIIDYILTEFRAPTSQGDHLSDAQTQILQKLINQFIKAC